MQDIIDTIDRCPSGALSYAIGGVELMEVGFGQGASREHYTLCRCGASKNKPFCDGSHWAVEFRDP